jgi:hypothetical protein
LLPREPVYLARTFDALPQREVDEEEDAEEREGDGPLHSSDPRDAVRILKLQYLASETTHTTSPRPLDPCTVTTTFTSQKYETPSLCHPTFFHFQLKTKVHNRTNNAIVSNLAEIADLQNRRLFTTAQSGFLIFHIPRDIPVKKSKKLPFFNKKKIKSKFE